MKRYKQVAMTAVMGGVLAITAGCGDNDASSDKSGNSAGGQLKGEVIQDGSSTVFPIMEAVAEEYMAEQPDVKVSVGASGTGGGFEKFIQKETDLSNASRPVKDEEKKLLEDNGVDYTELKLAYDGISIVVNKENDFIDHLTVEELKEIWIDDNGKEKKWSDIRSDWPDEPIKFYSPGTDSGTYDYFNEVILEEKPMVENATLSEDDNVLVKGVEGDKNAIGLFGYAYYAENKDQLKVVPIDNGEGAVEPNHETIKNGDYAPLSRPLFTYVSNSAFKDKEQVADYTRFAIENASELAEEVGYISLEQEDYDKDLELLDELEK
ncbi:PstS family phosphate ABC transporter substrate-binding protein [Bacillus massiliglaciei]|uniref:PstS family phosphate ABC transporter substrate-binding protein n=1 Tax=Bacillus massiliglaciei TaxID=1816693 RepID=UPI000AB68E09|nr:PstS family phosphate ABC transporter substrate-binding protein [Bacillus massiliglaciei]